MQNERQRVNLLSVVSKPTLAMRRPNPHALGRGSGTEHERRTRRVGGGGVSSALTLAWRCLLPWGDGRRGSTGRASRAPAEGRVPHPPWGEGDPRRGRPVGPRWGPGGPGTRRARRFPSPRLPPTDFFPKMDPLKLGGLKPRFKGFLKIRGQNRGGRRPLFGVFLGGWFFDLDSSFRPHGAPKGGRGARPTWIRTRHLFLIKETLKPLSYGPASRGSHGGPKAPRGRVQAPRAVPSRPRASGRGPEGPKGQRAEGPRAPFGPVRDFGPGGRCGGPGLRLRTPARGSTPGASPRAQSTPAPPGRWPARGRG